MKTIVLQVHVPEALLQSLVEEQVRQLVRERAAEILDAEVLFNTKEAADYLKITQKTLWKKCHEKEVPYSKVGSRSVFRKSELDTLLRQTRKKTGDELDIEAATYLMQKGR